MHHSSSQSCPPSRFLVDADWAGEWIARQQDRKKPDDPSVWDSRARDYGVFHAQSNYVQEFLERLHIKPHDLVLDMGCGPGSCALTLASQGISVVAVDFSQGMLAELKRRAVSAGVAERIRCIHASWEDDWDVAQIPQVDVAFASRSIMVADLKEALIKLTSRARRLVSASLIACPSPRHDDQMYTALGLTPPSSPDYIYAVQILHQLGYYANVSIINSVRQDIWRSHDEAYQAAIRGLPPLSQAQDAALRAYLDKHLIPASPEYEMPAGLMKDYQHVVRWAQLTWVP